MNVFMAGCMLTLIVFVCIPFIIFLAAIAFSSPLGFVIIALAFLVALGTE
jgi:hypothetical protein